MEKEATYIGYFKCVDCGGERDYGVSSRENGKHIYRCVTCHNKKSKEVVPSGKNNRRKNAR